MTAMLPPSRLLPATIVAAAVVLGIKAVALVTMAPSPGAIWAGTTTALEVAGTAHVMGQAQAATGQTSAFEPPPPPSTPQATAEPIQAAQPPVETSQVPAGDAGQDIKLRQSQIEEREQRLNEREATVAATDKHLKDRVAELVAIQSHLESLENERKSQEEANWTGLVKLYENMRARDAAAIFNGLDKPVLLEILDRMKPAKASPVIALMEPESARQVTAELANKRTRTTSIN